MQLMNMQEVAIGTCLIIAHFTWLFIAHMAKKLFLSESLLYNDFKFFYPMAERANVEHQRMFVFIVIIQQIQKTES